MKMKAVKRPGGGNINNAPSTLLKIILENTVHLKLSLMWDGCYLKFFVK